MKKTRWSFFVVIILFASLNAAAQTKSVTNADLEQYKEDRLKAKQEYRENYGRLGMPSPEEIDRQTEKDLSEMEQLSAKLRQEGLQQAAIDARGRIYQQPSQQYYSVSQGYYPYWDSGIWSASWLRPRFRRPRVTHHGLNGYVGGGQFWPSPGTRGGRWAPSGYVGGGNFWQVGGSTPPGGSIRHGGGGRR